MKLTLSGFQGANRALHPKLLPDGVGVASNNQKPGRGDLRPWRSPLEVATVPAGTKSLYRMGRDVASDALYWLSWPKEVHVSQGFEAGDSVVYGSDGAVTGTGKTERTYYTGDGAPKVTDTTLALAAAPYPMAARDLGVPKPPSAITASLATVFAKAGSAEAMQETVFYVYTYVSDWGSEGAPSNVSIQVDKQRVDTVSLTGFSAPPSGNYGINRMRIYRTKASAGGAEFYLFRTVAIGTQLVVDADEELGEVMPTATWEMPPADLKGLISLWNGMLAGISGNSVRFCEAYVPYAWPPEYDAVPPDGTPVALGVFGQSVLVLTTGRPLLLSGSSPDSMDQQPLEIPQGCMAARSVVSMGNGVAWSSNDGLCWYGAGGARILTSGIMTREDWQALRPASVIGCMYEGLYFGSYDDGTGRKGFMIDPGNAQGIYFLDVGFEAMHFDELQDQLYVVADNKLMRWDAGIPMQATFKSKVFRTPHPTNFSCAQVVADGYPLTVKVYADGVLQHTQTVENRQPFRLPSGFKAEDWQVSVVTNHAVQGLVIANNMSELGAV
jgi:hypothetical protein